MMEIPVKQLGMTIRHHRRVQHCSTSIQIIEVLTWHVQTFDDLPGNLLECLNLALNHFDQHHLDRLLKASGQVPRAGGGDLTWLNVFNVGKQ